MFLNSNISFGYCAMVYWICWSLLINCFCWIFSYKTVYWWRLSNITYHYVSDEEMVFVTIYILWIIITVILNNLKGEILQILAKFFWVFYWELVIKIDMKINRKLGMSFYLSHDYHSIASSFLPLLISFSGPLIFIINFSQSGIWAINSIFL